jgi:cyclin-dependent kinase 2
MHCKSDSRETAPAGRPRVRVIEDEYEILERLGKGTFGTVYKARDRHSNELVAIKEEIIKGTEPSDDGIGGLSYDLLREVAFLKDCDHPNIVRLKDMFFRSRPVQLVLEYLPMDLCKLLGLEKNRRGLMPTTVKRLMYQLLDGVSYISDKGIVHRDLKPQNLLVNPKTEVLKLCDFGLARTITPASGGDTPGMVCPPLLPWLRLLRTWAATAAAGLCRR